MSDLRNPIPTFGPPPSMEDIADMAERALATIPVRLARHVHGVGIGGLHGSGKLLLFGGPARYLRVSNAGRPMAAFAPM